MDAQVSERFGGVARVSSKGALATLGSLADATIEVAVNGTMQRLSVASAASIASAISSAIEHIRRENPALLDENAPTAAEIDLVAKVLEWARILQAEGRALDTITHSGIERSLLLRRLRSGRPALKAAPPTSFGQPWYDVLEADKSKVHSVACDGKVTTLAELLGTLDASATARNQFLVQINGCHWNVLKTVEFGARFVVAFQGHAQLFGLVKGPEGWLLRKIDTPNPA
ncbi:hypothetical protein BWI17_16215 [Betaproteobacteria bacterium GR16-43]|nr:hypothetical protein BWI17_16215 [Betaproteobacteria bacterium GR16-43]